MTDAEHRLWRDLRAGRLLAAKFRRQEPVGPYIADFISFEHRLVVEADGGQHVGSAPDVTRDQWFESQGYRVMRFWNDDILKQPDRVLDAIAIAVEERTLSPTPPPSRGRGSEQSETTTTHARSESPGGNTTRSHREEVRLYGLNACVAAFAARPQDLRKVYLAEARIATLRNVLAYCVKQRLGYRVVEEADLDKLAASSHHEGVVFEMKRRADPSLAELLATLPAGPQVLLWLDGVGNPHNFGALLRNSAHFGVAAVVLPPTSTLTLSGAACRVAEGGAESVPVVRLTSVDSAIAQLHGAGFALAATLPNSGESIYAAALPPRLVLLFGAESGGMQPALVQACALRLSIPGSGKVESLNIANAVGVMLGECWRRHHA